MKAAVLVLFLGFLMMMIICVFLGEKIKAERARADGYDMEVEEMKDCVAWLTWEVQDLMNRVQVKENALETANENGRCRSCEHRNCDDVDCDLNRVDRVSDMVDAFMANLDEGVENV